MPVTLQICESCDQRSLGLIERLREAAPNDITITPSPCMNVCTKPITCALHGRGMTYIFGDCDPDGDFETLQTLIRLYHTADQGNITDARPLGDLRHKLIARIPPVS